MHVFGPILGTREFSNIPTGNGTERSGGEKCLCQSSTFTPENVVTLLSLAKYSTSWYNSPRAKVKGPNSTTSPARRMSSWHPPSKPYRAS